MSEETTAEVGSFPACQISLVNPVGAMLVLRADNVEGLVGLLNGIWDSQLGKREDVTNLFLFSFNPAIIADMREGRSAEQAMGYEPNEMATAAYNALAEGAKRRPVASAGANGTKGKGAGKFKVGDDGHAEGDLPAFFIDKLTRRNTCPECDGDEFWDNRGSDVKGPVFRCTNQSCDAGKGYPWGVFEPDERPRSRSGSRTR
jgi:hypothetical protein